MNIPYRVKRAFQVFRVGQFIYPTGLQRDHLLSYGYIEATAETEAALKARREARLLAEGALVPPPEPEPEPESVEDLEPEAEEADPLVEAAVMPEPERAAFEAPRRGPGRPRKV